MKDFDGWQFPDAEEHMVSWMLAQQQAILDHTGRARLTYQYHKYITALGFVSPDARRRAVDVGAHVGLWSYWMARDFHALDAFEPATAHVECWMRNVVPWRTGQRIIMHATALGGQQYRTVGLKNATPDSTGNMELDPYADVRDIPVVSLDSFNLTDVDFLKIDCEGTEADVIKGAVETIQASWPVIIIEQKKNVNALVTLEMLGYKIRKILAGDYILTIE